MANQDPERAAASRAEAGRHQVKVAESMVGVHSAHESARRSSSEATHHRREARKASKRSLPEIAARHIGAKVRGWAATRGATEVSGERKPKTSQPKQRKKKSGDYSVPLFRKADLCHEILQLKADSGSKGMPTEVLRPGDATGPPMMSKGDLGDPEGDRSNPVHDQSMAAGQFVGKAEQSMDHPAEIDKALAEKRCNHEPGMVCPTCRKKEAYPQSYGNNLGSQMVASQGNADVGVPALVTTKHDDPLNEEYGQSFSLPEGTKGISMKYRDTTSAGASDMNSADQLAMKALHEKVASIEKAHTELQKSHTAILAEKTDLSSKLDSLMAKAEEFLSKAHKDDEDEEVKEKSVTGDRESPMAARPPTGANPDAPGEDISLEEEVSISKADIETLIDTKLQASLKEATERNRKAAKSAPKVAPSTPGSSLLSGMDLRQKAIGSLLPHELAELELIDRPYLA